MTTYELDMNRLADGLAGCGKIPRSPFDKLRANGTGIEIIGNFPFVLSPSKHENGFFSSLLGVELDPFLQKWRKMWGKGEPV